MGTVSMSILSWEGHDEAWKVDTEQLLCTEKEKQASTCPCEAYIYHISFIYWAGNVFIVGNDIDNYLLSVTSCFPAACLRLKKG